MKKICVVAVDIRSAHNIGSILRTADGFSAEVIITGISPYPKLAIDERLPHIASKTDKSIAKTALGAETSVKWRYIPEVKTAIDTLKNEGYRIVSLEQTHSAIQLPAYKTDTPVALVVGPEVTGLNKDVIEICDETIEIPMSGKKESFNVSVATGIALYHIRHVK